MWTCGRGCACAGCRSVSPTWDTARRTQAAGLTHAAYGTDGFDLALLDRDSRGTSRDLIGAAAESLVYLYGACDRERSWPRPAQTGEVTDRFMRRGTRGPGGVDQLAAASVRG